MQILFFVDFVSDYNEEFIHIKGLLFSVVIYKLKLA